MMDNEKAWDFAIGIVQADGTKPSDYFMELVEREKRGEITGEDIRQLLNEKYTVIPDDEETLYLSSIPEIKESIIEGLNTPISECIPESEVEW